MKKVVSLLQPKFIRFLTNSVVILIAIGVILIITGVTGFASSWMSDDLPKSKEAINNILRTVGTAVLGGGVFSALIQSQRFTEVYQKVFEDALWKPDFLKKRGDIREVWNNVSRVLYQEKFPTLNSEIEEIITTEYFPTNHKFYIENYDLTITLIEKNDNYIEHIEFLSVTLKPAHGENDLIYGFCSYVNIPKIDGVPDETNLEIQEIIVNGEPIDVNQEIFKTEKNSLQHKFDFSLKLGADKDQNLIIKRKKTLEKISNKDKRFFARYFQKDSKVTIIAPVGLEVALYPMGTVKEFIKSSEQVNGGLRILKYYYTGLILPKQGFFIMVN
ncbi:hypothetical protein JMG10_21090 [Nostoc ellipsosporum NOK]|nr:hypothetical protein [Nostoc ellipsosporum NOK]